jgi:HPr kinase/phosphorylase
VNVELTCNEILDDTYYRLGLKLLAGAAGLDNVIKSSHIQKPGLALAGYSGQMHLDRVQILGETEMEFLGTMPSELRDIPIKRIFGLGVTCFMVTKGLELPKLFMDLAEEHSIPLMRTELTTTEFIERLERMLETRLAPHTHMHGVLVDVMGVGVLLKGPSGVGKSECAMDMVLRGHRLVADDVVQVSMVTPYRLIGRGAGIIRYHMEIRGLGIINIQDLFGHNAVRAEKSLDLVIDLVHWDEDEQYDRLGFDEARQTILDVEVPCLKIPVAPGRNMASVVEVAARNHLLKAMGRNSAITIKQKLEEKLGESK